MAIRLGGGGDRTTTGLQTVLNIVLNNEVTNG